MVRDYSKGFIYKLCCKDVNVKEIYVGSSINMKHRKNQHKTACNNINSPKYSQKNYQYIRENGGWDNWSMIWIKDYPSNSKRELEAEEDKIMRELNSSLNSNNTIFNKEKRKEYRIQYRILNKERIKTYEDKYNKSRDKEKMKKDKRERRITCECGSELRKSDIARHRKSKKHQNLISS